MYLLYSFPHPHIPSFTLLSTRYYPLCYAHMFYTKSFLLSRILTRLPDHMIGMYLSYGFSKPTHGDTAAIHTIQCIVLITQQLSGGAETTTEVSGLNGKNYVSHCE